MKEMVGGCCVCSDDRGWPENPLVYCDGQSCTVAVHQACYGIVTVPTGPWYCRKCESQERSVKVKCELCPSKYGALKRTDNSGWAHVVCALYIPEVRFGNVTTMEPIQLQLIPAERFNKVCYICEEKGRPSNSSVGACMQCNKSGCKQQFHVTCAQALGLLCEEAGNYLDNVKYCGYCQHHYSKLKKGGNVKTIPPYKPVSTENQLSDSNSEKEAEVGATPTATKPTSQTTTSSGKRKSTSNTKTASTKTSSSTKSSVSSSSAQKTTHNSGSKSAEKPKVSNSNSKSAKTPEESTPINSVDSSVDTKTEKSVSSAKDIKTETVEVETVKIEPKEPSSKGGKKRKANSRTPTPITVVPSENISVVISASSIISDSQLNLSNSSDKKESPIPSDTVDKSKKAKIEQTPVTTSSPPSIALNTATTAKVSTPVVTETITATTTPTAATTTSSIIQSTGHQSLVVSVPLHNSTISPSKSPLNPANIVTSPPAYAHLPQDIENSISASQGSSLTTAGTNSNMLTSELSSGGLKITYEKQPNSGSQLQVELERMTPTEIPAKRSRSQSGEKVERPTRTKKRGANGSNAQFNNSVASTSVPKRSSRSQHATPPPVQTPSTSFASLPPAQIKESPPSSPSSESMGSAPPVKKNKGRKSAPASVSSVVTVNKEVKEVKEVKDIKIFQNGVHAPHMLGNQLNPNSNMAQKMSDHLNSELEAHSIFNPNENSNNMVGPQLHHKVIASTRTSSAGSSTASGGSGLSSMLGGSGGVIPQTLDQLLERQWEQGSQFLMEQAQHFDIASLLSCLHQLRAENLRLEEHVSSLLQRRDHLLAVNARLAIPLTGPPATPQSSHPHTVNNIHPSVAASHAEAPRSRHSGGYSSSHGQSTPQLPTGPIENGLPPDANQGYPHQHRNEVANQPQPSPNVRHSPSGMAGFPPNSGMIRQNTESSSRSSQRPQSYPICHGSSSSSGQQMVINRRESDPHHQSSSKPS